MSDAITDTRKKRGRPKVGALQVQVRVPPDLLEALDHFAADQEAASRPDAIRTLVQDRLAYLGYLKTEV